MKIRQIDNYDDLSGIEALQTAIWQFEPMAVTPRHVFIAAIRSGGLVLTAYDDQDTLIGFALAFRGERQGQAVLYSHLVGILPSMQSHGVGYILKMRQREHAMEQGLEAIVWTFDPLLAKNACLNLQKLGGRVYTFIPNAYGASAFKIFGDGFLTHRFEVFWHLKNSPTFDAGLFETSKRLINTQNGNEPLVDRALLEGAEGEPLILPIPAHHLPMRIENPALAHQWQDSVCHCAQVLLARGYAIAGFSAQEPYGQYLLTYRPLP